jgi:ABC transporter permease protein 2
MITAITLIAQAAPLLIAACAALVSEYAGLLNVGIEGLMLLSAFTGIGGILLTEGLGGLIPGLAVSLALGAGLSMFITYLAIYRKANIYILGLAVNLTSAGFVSILSTRFFGNRSIVALPPELLLQPQLVKMASAALAVLTGLGLALFCRYTKTGLRIKILGKDSAFLDSIGVHTARLKIAAMGMSGAAAALAGCLLSLQLGAFVPNQSAGKGWIALVLAYAGGRSVIGTICAALLFVYLENTIAAAQIGMEHPALLIGLPFVLGLFLIIAEKLIIRIWKRYRGK